MKNTQKQAGFTLVELAIVMVIIGLLIGGILKGQELITNASISSTAAKLKAFESAFMTFQDTYKQKPGDMQRATSKIPECAGWSSCRNGNGDGFIHYSNSIQTTALASVGLEHFQAMKHLALANMIGGVDGRAAGGAQASENYPVSDLNGFLYIGESRGNLRGAWSGNAALPAGILVGQTPRLNNWAANNVGSTASEIARLDRKIDDGSPFSGTMQGVGSTGCFRGREYRENWEAGACNFVYKIN